MKHAITAATTDLRLIYTGRLNRGLRGFYNSGKCCSPEPGAFGGTTRIIQGLGAFCDRQAAKDIQAFFNRHPVPGAERALARTLEDIEACATLATSHQPTLLSTLTDKR